MKRLVAAVAVLIVCLAAAWWGLPSLFVQPLLHANRMSAGLAERTVAAAGHEVHYLEGGQGEALVLLHGIFAEKDHWVDFARPLTGSWRVVAPDLPGFGQSGRKEGEPYDYAAQVQRLQALLDALQIRRAHLAGSSMGGTLAVLFAQQHPARVASVALIGSPHGIRSPQASEMDARIDAGEAPLVARSPQDFQRMAKLVFAQPPWIPSPILHRAQETAARNAGSDLRIWREQLKDRYLLDDRIAALAAPTLVLWGDADRVFHPSGAAVLRARLPHAQVQLLPGVGHLPMMEAPADAAAAYQRFLRALPRPGRP
jgi:pimeloyl-ACP methyl ester carboxylesterase